MIDFSHEEAEGLNEKLEYALRWCLFGIYGCSNLTAIVTG